MKGVFFLNAYGTFTRTEHTLGHETGLNKHKHKKTEIPGFFSDHMKLDSITSRASNGGIGL